MNTNSNNKHQVRNKLVCMLQEELKLTEIEAKDLEIGIFNASIDYANSLKIQTSWSCDLFAETYLNIAMSIYSNLDKDSYIKNERLLDRLKNREFLPHKLPYMNCEEIFPEILSAVEKELSNV